MTQKQSPEHHLRTALQRRGVAGRSLETVLVDFEERGDLGEVELALEGDDGDYLNYLEDLAIRLARRFEEHGDVAPDGQETVVVQHRQPDGLATANLWLLLQRLVVRDVSHWPPLRDWRRRHLGGPRSVLTYEEAEPWILKNTTDWGPGSPHKAPSEPFIWHLFGDPLVRGVPEGSPVHSLRELAKSLVDTTGWSERDATIWVLTDRLPPASGLSIGVKYREFGLTPTMVIEVSPLVSERTLLIWYRQFRQRVLGGRRPAPSRKVLEMAQFVLDYPKLSWENRCSQWNATHPGSPYSSGPNMKRMYFGLLRKLQSARGPKLRRFSTHRSTGPTPLV